MREQAVATALLSAIAHRVESPFSSRLTKHQIDVAYDSPTQILAIAVWTGIDIRDSHYVNANGYESDVAELFRRITLKVSSEIQDTWLCIDSLDKGLRYITQDLEWLRRTHRNYRIYHNYGVAIKTRATGEWFDQGEDCSTSGYRCGKKGARRRAGRRG
ncbi:hypothetical protein B0J17DRAFT_708362 [Rhizoctonia solani]|nr:hypothetical protein B0J17DRAFT_708362 [Rhizoctonia solani]